MNRHKTSKIDVGDFFSELLIVVFSGRAQFFRIFSKYKFFSFENYLHYLLARIKILILIRKKGPVNLEVIFLINCDKYPTTRIFSLWIHLDL